MNRFYFVVDLKIKMNKKTSTFDKFSRGRFQFLSGNRKKTGLWIKNEMVPRKISKNERL